VARPLNFFRPSQTPEVFSPLPYRVSYRDNQNHIGQASNDVALPKPKADAAIPSWALHVVFINLRKAGAVNWAPQIRQPLFAVLS
jgi:hypothetical protein